MAAAGLAGLVAPSTAGAAGVSHAVVVHGLNNPRGLDMADGVLLIAEAGKGGTLGTVNDPEGGANTLGLSSSISAVHQPGSTKNSVPNRIVTGLLSGAAANSSPDGPKGGFALGVDGVAARHLNDIAAIETTFGPATPRIAKARDGHLLGINAHRNIRAIANITGYERTRDPDRQGVDSDPYAVVNFGTGWLVADAAGNSILKVSSAGLVTKFHVFHNVTSGPCLGQHDPAPPFLGCNFVPTSMAVDANNNVYVGGLSSLIPGQAQLVKLNSSGTLVKRWTGFSSITGVAVRGDGTLYVSQLFADPSHPGLPGVLTRIKGSTRTNVDVPFPAGLALDSNGNVYVSAFSVFPGTGAGIPGIDSSGQVWRLHF